MKNDHSFTLLANNDILLQGNWHRAAASRGPPTVPPHSQALLARIYPDRKIRHSRQLMELDVRQVPESRGGGIEQCTQNSRSCLFEVSAELALIAARFLA